MTMIETTSGKLTLGEVADLVGVDLSTVWRWCLRGVRGRKLPSKRIGGRRYVLPADLEAFLADDDGEKRPPAETSEKQRRRAEKASAKLDHLGIGT